MAIKIALAGNPNSGKTTLFNALTGSNQYVGNWPGVTVEKKEGKLKWNKEVRLVDLPGIYSLSPYTLEEVVARNVLLGERPDAIIDIVDGTNLERNLYLTTQILELDIPVVVAVNMTDLLEKNGITIDTAKLGAALDCKVVNISALKGTGVREAADLAVQIATAAQISRAAASQASQTAVAAAPRRPAALTFSPQIEQALTAIEGRLGDEIEPGQKRFYAIKLFERDEKITAGMQQPPDVEDLISAVETELDDDAESIITGARYTCIEAIVKTCCKKKQDAPLSLSDRIDRIVTNRILGLPIFVGVMFLVYYISISTLGSFLTDWVNDVLFGELILPSLATLLDTLGVASWLSGLIVDGIVSGVGAVLGFVPQMLVLFFCLAILEGCGYMARVAFIMDRIFRKFGLSGKSFIPMLIGTGCGVPAIMASRTIEADRDRKMTIMTTTFIPCGAKIPIIALIAGTFFNDAAWVSTCAYFIGVAAVVISGIILKKTRMFAGDPAPFVMELPAYHLPTPGYVLRSMWERGWSFIKKAGTIILLSTILVWFLSSFSFQGGFHMLDDVLEQDTSILAALGNMLAWIFVPLGFGNWQATVASLTGLIAKENLVSTYGILYGFAEVAENGAEFWPMLAAAMTPAAGFSYLVFNLLCAPCFAAMGAIKREMNSTKWFWFAIGYQCTFAYAISLCIYQFWTLFTGGGFGIGTVVAIAIVIAIVYLLVRRAPESDRLDDRRDKRARAAA